VSTPPNGGISPGAPPYVALRERLAAALRDARGQGEAALIARAERELEAWWAEQSGWDARLIELLRVHHDINNALVGVSGNVQLMMRDPIARDSGVRERLEVMLRESSRIQTAAVRLRELKTALQGGSRDARAA